METNCVVEHLPHVREDLEWRSAALLNRVDGEFQDEDGDWATDFILADPMPKEQVALRGERRGNESSSFDQNSSLSFARRVESQGDADASFVCGVCGRCVLLEMLGPDLRCSCLFCTPCLMQHVEACLALYVSVGCETKEKNGLNHRKYQTFRNLADSFNCPSCACTGAITLSAIQSFAPETFKKWHETANEVLFQTANFVKCPGCHVMIEKVIGDIPAGVAPSGVPELDRTLPFTEFDDDGNPMSRAALLDKFNNYFRCALCKVGFCGLCMTYPYHLGYTCQEYKDFKEAARCTYCQAPIVKTGLCDREFSSMTVKELHRDLDRAGLDTSWCVEKRELVGVRRLASTVCDSKDCRNKLSQACTRSLECGHRCGGLRGERVCLPCLDDGCRETAVLRKGHKLPSADDWCSICMVEPLRSAPSIELKCGHIVHFACAKKKLKEGFPGPEISFGYLNCPQCKTRMEHESLMHDMQKPLELLNFVKEKALKRLKMDKVQPFVESEELEANALRKYQYYICCKCKNPYFGGNRDCAADLGIQENEIENLHNPLELVCGGCSAAIGNHMTCTKGHGREYVEFKCRYCCSLATYFCFGRIHFCTSCHLTRPDVYRDFIPQQCKGPQSCPLKVAHAPNGEEYCLGCSMCRLLNQ